MLQTAQHTQTGDPGRQARAGLQAFFNIAQRWKLKDEQARVLLGEPSRSQFYRMKRLQVPRLDRDTLERISYVLGIYKALHILLPEARLADGWVSRPNDARIFGGRSALEKMLGGNVVDLADVRRYLDAQRG